MATAIEAGMQETWLEESDDYSRTLAKANCQTVSEVFNSIYDRNPISLPWVHVLLGGECCQPFSRAGRSTGLARQSIIYHDPIPAQHGGDATMDGSE